MRWLKALTAFGKTSDDERRTKKFMKRRREIIPEAFIELKTDSIDPYGLADQIASQMGFCAKTVKRLYTEDDRGGSCSCMYTRRNKKLQIVLLCTCEKDHGKPIKNNFPPIY